MPQGTLKKLSNKVGGVNSKKKSVSKKSKSQRKHFRPKGKKANDIHAKMILETTKSINRKNEKLVAAKAISNGVQLSTYSSDIQQRGIREMNEQIRKRNKKQNTKNKSKVTEKLKDQIRKLE